MRSSSPDRTRGRTSQTILPENGWCGRTESASAPQALGRRFSHLRRPGVRLAVTAGRVSRRPALGEAEKAAVLPAREPAAAALQTPRVAPVAAVVVVEADRAVRLAPRGRSLGLRRG